MVAAQSNGANGSGAGTTHAAAARARAFEAQRTWRDVPVRQRLAIVRRLRHALAERGEELAAAVHGRRAVAHVLSSQVLPLADACRFLEREAEALLSPRALGRRGRPLWLHGSEARIEREPFGVVLVVGPSNYPVLLPTVHALQALVAGNAVLLKPGPGGAGPAALFAEMLTRAGLPAGLLVLLDESTQSVDDAIDAGVDKVVLTGASSTGRTVLSKLASSLTPSVLELSGCDAAFVLDDADIALTARALAFGSRLNDGYTCIAPRRVFVARGRVRDLERALAAAAAQDEPLRVDDGLAGEITRVVGDALSSGARLLAGRLPSDGEMTPIVLTNAAPDMEIMRADLAAPVQALCAVDDDEQALGFAARCPYELGASVFGGAARASRLATRLRAGVVVINDMIVPTADPRLPFGGRGESGFGVTRGAEGLLALTRPRAVVRRSGRFRPHLEPAAPGDERLFSAWLAAAHGGSLVTRIGALWRLVRELARRGVAQDATAGGARGENTARAAAIDGNERTSDVAAAGRAFAPLVGGRGERQTAPRDPAGALGELDGKAGEL